jgi:hypothetical protein
MHNLRAALDHVVFEVALNNSGGTLSPAEEEALMFPIRHKPHPRSWEQVVKDRLPHVPPSVITVIEAAQPYRRTSSAHPTAHLFEPLWRVHDLDRIDKHRRLAVTTTALSHHAFGVDADADPEIRFYHAEGRVTDGQLLATYRIVEGEAEAANQTVKDTLGHVHRQVAWTVHRVRVAATPRDNYESEPDLENVEGGT